MSKNKTTTATLPSNSNGSGAIASPTPTMPNSTAKLTRMQLGDTSYTAVQVLRALGAFTQLDGVQCLYVMHQQPGFAWVDPKTANVQTGDGRRQHARWLARCEAAKGPAALGKTECTYGATPGIPVAISTEKGGGFHLLTALGKATLESLVKLGQACPTEFRSIHSSAGGNGRRGGPRGGRVLASIADLPIPASMHASNVGDVAKAAAKAAGKAAGK